MKPLRFILPLFIFVALCGLFFIGLGKDSQYLPSALIGEQAPKFTLTSLETSPNNAGSTFNTDNTINQEVFKDKKSIVNIWASWCAACRIEHPFFNQISKHTDWQIIGLNYKDESHLAVEWLDEMKNPYHKIIFDPKGSLGLDLGVYGVPETFLLDENGVIRYKHTGPICPAIIANVFDPFFNNKHFNVCLLYTSPSPRDS